MKAPITPPTSVPAPPSTAISSASTEVVSSTLTGLTMPAVCAHSTPDKSAEGAGDDEGDVFVQPGVVAEDLHAQLALADAGEAAPERRAHQRVHQQQRDAEEAEHQVEERHLVGEVDTPNFGRSRRLMPLSPPVSEFQR